MVISKNQLHIVSFDVPYPPNYGGVIDVFYKLKALFDLGIEIYFHTFVESFGFHPSRAERAYNYAKFVENEFHKKDY